MKQAVSISLGHSKRDKTVSIELLGEEITIKRIGTNGDIQKAIQLYNQLDGQVDAFGVGGIDLGLSVAGRYYPLYQAQQLVADVKQTPVVDGGGLKKTLERRIAQFIEHQIGSEIEPKRVLITSGVDRYGSAESFAEAGYSLLLGDLGFALGLPIPIRTLAGLRLVARTLLPVLGHLPLDYIYPTGEKQEENIPKFRRWYSWATVISGDCLYIRRHMPPRLDGKVVATNTTTDIDVEDFRNRGVRYLITSTPPLDGRSFGTNMMEAALVAVASKGRPLTEDELRALLDQLGLQPTLRILQE